MRHPDYVWTDPSYKDEAIDKAKAAWKTNLAGRATPASPRTITKYLESLTSLCRYLSAQGEPLVLASITPANVHGWIAQQRQAGRSEDGIASRLSAVKVFTSKFLQKELEGTNVDLLRKVERITPPERLFPLLTATELDQTIECFDRPVFEDARDKAIIMVIASTGMRAVEVATLEAEKVDKLTGDISFVGKGNKERQARLSPPALKAVKAYLRVRPTSLSARLFVQADGAELTYWGFRSILRRHKKRSGVERVRPHLYRHGFATNALDKGADPSTVQEMLGHSTNVMTRRYTKQARQRAAAKQMPKYSPV